MLEPGLQGTARLTVDIADTATAVGSGDVPVLATPRLIALCEEASLAAVHGHLAAGETTVGSRIEIDHLAPTPIGRPISAIAVLESIDGKLLRFAVAAVDGDRDIATGTLHRFVVDREQFLARSGAGS